MKERKGQWPIHITQNFASFECINHDDNLPLPCAILFAWLMENWLSEISTEGQLIDDCMLLDMQIVSAGRADKEIGASME